MNLTPEELELTVLSSAVKHGADGVLKVETAGIGQDSFQVDAHGEAWEYLIEAARRGATVTEEDVKAATGVELNPLISDDVTFTNELVRVSTARHIRQAILRSTADLDKDPTGTSAKIIGALNDVRRGAKGKSLTYDGDIDERIAAYEAKHAKAEAGEAVGIPTGLPCFDDKGDTWQPGEVVAIIGPLNVGKSTLLFWLASNVYHKARRKVLVLSPESTITEVEAKFDATIGGWEGYDFSVRGIIQGRQKLKPYKDYLEKLKAYSRRDLIIKDSGETGNFTIGDIVSQVRLHEPDFLVIDGFHLIRGENGETWQTMKLASETIKGLAQSMGMTVCVTSQVQRSALLMPDDTAEIAQSAYGLALSETANRVISLGEVRNEPGQRMFKVPKMRNAAKINFKQFLHYDVDRGYIAQVVGNEDLSTGYVSFP